MGIFSKLAFWKKKDDLGLGEDFGADIGLGQMEPTGHELGLPRQYGMERDLGLSSRDLGMSENMGFGTMPSMPPGRSLPPQQPFAAPIQPPPPTERDYQSEKFEVVSAKLDSIRYTLESINQRLANLERLAYGEEKKGRW